jgi:signal transduction histidine kinase
VRLEEERTRIARELHDDISQRIALQELNLESLKDALPSATDWRETSRSPRSNLRSWADVQGLSHRLHSSGLDALGLEVAAGFCREVPDWQEVEIDFHCENVQEGLSQEISLCLFRVMQEALQNAIKHSGSRHFDVSLRDELNEVIQLNVRDSRRALIPRRLWVEAGLA